MRNYTIKFTYQCDNKWDEMIPQDNGRHCGSCNKVVVDFTQMSDRDIIQYLMKNTHTCGLFKKSQVNRPMFLYNIKRKSSWPAIAAMLISGLFSISPSALNATNSKPAIEFHSTINSEVEPEKTNQAFPIKLMNSKTNEIISWGNIYIDQLGSFFADQTGIIQVINTIEAPLMPDSFIVVVSAGGYTTKTFTFYTKDLQQATGATIYLEELKQDEIMPPGTVAIHENDIPQKQTK